MPQCKLRKYITPRMTNIKIIKPDCKHSKQQDFYGVQNVNIVSFLKAKYTAKKLGSSFIISEIESLSKLLI